METIPDKPSRQVFNVVFFWKQHDTGIYGRRQEMIARYMLKSGRVGRILHLEPPVYLSDLCKYAFRALKRRKTHFGMVLKNTLRRLVSRRTGDNFIEFTPFSFVPGWLNRRWIRRIRWNLIHKSIKLFMRIHHLEDRPIILWCCPAHPFIENLLHIIPYTLACADCIDDNRAWYEPGTSRYRKIDENYRHVLSRVDVGFAVNEYLTETMKEYNPDMVWIPNAVESPGELPGRAQPEPLPWKHPILGYVGNLSARIDANLLRLIAVRRPEWNIVLVGSTHASDDRILELDRIPNIHFQGPIPYPEVASVIRQFDVAIVPHLDNPISRNMDPLKMYLFLSLGIPVVATECSGISRFENYIELAAGTDQFIRNIETLLNQDTRTRETWKRAVLEFLGEHTWEKRLAEIMRHIDAALAKKSSGK